MLLNNIVLSLNILLEEPMKDKKTILANNKIKLQIIKAYQTSPLSKII